MLRYSCIVRIWLHSQRQAKKDDWLLARTGGLGRGVEVGSISVVLWGPRVRSFLGKVSKVKPSS